MTIITTAEYTVLHTEGAGPAADTSFQKAAWPLERRILNLSRTFNLCEEAGIQARGNLAALGFNQANCSVREISEPDDDLLVKQDGNVLLTNTDVALITWAADCCLVALIGDDGEWVAVLHASVNTFKNGIIDVAIQAMRDKGTKFITAYVGVCADKCCYEYGAEQAARDFAAWPEFIIPDKPGKVHLDLGGAVRESLDRNGATVVDIFPDCHCNMCAKGKDGSYRFPSYRRDVDENGNHINGQYALIVQKKH